MKIYLLMPKNNATQIKNYLKDIEVINLYAENKKVITGYDELIQDNEDKIVVIEPGFFEWKFSNEAMDLIPNLKGIVTRSSWGNFMDVAYAKSKDIVVANAPGANSQSVAEYAIFQMLALFRKLPLQLKENFLTQIDDEHEGDTAKNKTVGILGFGKVGSKIASLCDGMGMKVIYWSKHKKECPYEFAELNDVISRADVIFKTWEIIPETDKLLNEDNLKLLKSNCMFISVFGGIGWCSDDYLLLDLAEKGFIGGFSVENEHKQGAIVKNEYMGNIFLPAAYAWHTKETHAKYVEIVAQSILGILENKPINRVE